MTEDTLLPFDLPAVQRKKVTADFAGGSISSDGGPVLLRAAERRLGLTEALAGCIRDWRDPDRVVHTLPAMLRFRMFAIACGYEDVRVDEGRAGPGVSARLVRQRHPGFSGDAHGELRCFGRWAGPLRPPARCLQRAGRNRCQRRHGARRPRARQSQVLPRLSARGGDGAGGAVCTPAPSSPRGTGAAASGCAEGKGRTFNSCRVRPFSSECVLQSGAFARSHRRVPAEPARSTVALELGPRATTRTSRIGLPSLNLTRKTLPAYP